MKTVTITLEGGVIQFVDVPEGVKVVLCDYDVGDTAPDDLSTDDHGDKYIRTVWSYKPDTMIAHIVEEDAS